MKADERYEIIDILPPQYVKIHLNIQLIWFLIYL